MYEERPSTSPHIQFVWRAVVKESGSFADLAHDFWVLVFRNTQSVPHVILTGPVMHSQLITYEAGQINWGIVFKAHVFINTLPKKTMLNMSTSLPMVNNHSFRFGKHTLEIPHFDEAEGFVDELIKKRVLTVNMAVSRALQGASLKISSRSLQRHYKTTTGLTKSQMEQIKRARKAYYLLQQGKSLIDTAFEAGYADQAHMTRSLKLLAGQTPGQILSEYLSK
jgi:AraC-like DNA-binding protein